MALNRYLYPAKNSNLPEFVIMSQRWGVGVDGAVTPLGATTDLGRGLELNLTAAPGVSPGSYILKFAPTSDGLYPSVGGVVQPIVTIMDSTVPTLVQITDIGPSYVTFQVTTYTGAPDNVSNGGKICVSLICTNSSVVA